MKEPQYIDEKNHVNISEGVDNTNLSNGGFSGYGQMIQGLKYLTRFPFLFYHQLICKNNEWCRFHSERLWREYRPTMTSYQEYLKKCVEQAEPLKIKKVETLG